MHRLRVIIYTALGVAWFAFAWWQYRGYRQQVSLIEESLYQQSQSIMTALVGGLQSHRRLGRYFEDQLQAMLDELVKSEDVLSVAIRERGGPMVLAAGQRPEGGVATPSMAGRLFYVKESFSLSPASAAGRGGGGGWGMGGGRGRGSGGWFRGEEAPETEGPFAAGGDFTAELLLSRERANALARRAGWTHSVAVVAAALVALSIGLVSHASMNLAEAKGRARVYEAEMRHLQDLSQAAAGLAHETRNPLGLIRGWTQRLTDTGMSDAQRREHAHAVMEECDRLTARINQFLAFARPCEPRVEAVAISNLLDELAMILQPDLEARAVQLVCRVDEGSRQLQADFELLRQVLFNLVQNAIHFSPSGGSIEVTVAPRRGSKALLRVADQGPGVSEDAVNSLFTPYFTTRPEGTGLGLAIVRHIATLHDWKVTYQAGQGGGAVFEVDGIDVAK